MTLDRSGVNKPRQLRDRGLRGRPAIDSVSSDAGQRAYKSFQSRVRASDTEAKVTVHKYPLPTGCEATVWEEHACRTLSESRAHHIGNRGDLLADDRHEPEALLVLRPLKRGQILLADEEALIRHDNSPGFQQGSLFYSSSCQVRPHNAWKGLPANHTRA